MLLFDMDGTLIDSNGIWKEVDTEFLARRGLPYTQEYYEGVAHTIFPLAAKFTKEFCRLPESEETLYARYQIILRQRGQAYKRIEEAKAAAAYMDEKVKHYQRILSGSIPDDSNPEHWTDGTRPERHRLTE